MYWDERMSIFINDKIKQNTIRYWFGLMVPILIGVGCSLLSLSILMTHDGPVSELRYIDYFFVVFWVSGTLVIWPLSAWWLIRRAKKSEDVPRIKGAYASLKLYMLWLFYILSNVILSVMAGE